MEDNLENVQILDQNDKLILDYKIIMEYGPKILYLYFISSIIPNISKTTQYFEFFSTISESQHNLEHFISNPQNRSAIDKMISHCNEYLLPTHERWELIFKDFVEYKIGKKIEDIPKDTKLEELLFKDKDSLKGYSYLWLSEKFDMPNIKQNVPLDLPAHGWLGVFDNAGVASTDENFLIEKACFYLVKAEYYYKYYRELLDSNKHLFLNNTLRIELTNISTFVGIYSTQAFLNLFAFIECFVNSVSWNYLQNNNVIDSDLKCALSGSSKLSDGKSNKFFGIEMRLLCYPKIISQKILEYKETNKIRDHIATDLEIYRNKFTKFFHYKDMRDSYMHYNESSDKNLSIVPKNQIALSDEKWLEIAKGTFKSVLEIAIDFWKNCGYGDEPQYINLKEEEILIKQRQLINEEISIINRIERS